jgi:hypothetical protein
LINFFINYNCNRLQGGAYESIEKREDVY